VEPYSTPTPLGIFWMDISNIAVTGYEMKSDCLAVRYYSLIEAMFAMPTQSIQATFNTNIFI